LWRGKRRGFRDYSHFLSPLFFNFMTSSEIGRLLVLRSNFNVAIDTYTYNCTNIDTYTDIHPIIVVVRVLVLTHTAKDYFEEVRQVVVITVTLCVIVQTSLGNTTINTIIIFAVVERIC